MGYVNTPYGEVFVDTNEIQREFTRQGVTYTGDGSEFVDVINGEVIVRDRDVADAARRAAQEKEDQARYKKQGEDLIRALGGATYIEVNDEASCFIDEDGDLCGMRLIHYPDNFNCKYRRSPVRYGPFVDEDEAIYYAMKGSKELADLTVLCPYCCEKVLNAISGPATALPKKYSAIVKESIRKGTDRREYYERQVGHPIILPAEEAAREAAARRNGQQYANRAAAAQAGQQSTGSTQSATRPQATGSTQGAPRTQTTGATQSAQRTQSSGSTQAVSRQQSGRGSSNGTEYTVCSYSGCTREALLKAGVPERYEEFVVEKVLVMLDKKEVHLGIYTLIPESVKLPEMVSLVANLNIYETRTLKPKTQVMGTQSFKVLDSHAFDTVPAGFKEVCFSKTYKMSFRERKLFDRTTVRLEVMGMKMAKKYTNFQVDKYGNEI